MKREKYNPYGIVWKYELETYQHIGRDYGNAKTAPKGLILNFLRFLRKRFNKGEKRYKFCDTYSEWKEHIIQLPANNTLNKKDFFHWVVQQERYAKRELEIIKLVLIPLYITLLSLYEVFFVNGDEKPSVVIILAMIIIVIIFSCQFYFKTDIKVSFYEDITKIFEELVNDEKVK